MCIEVLELILCKFDCIVRPHPSLRFHRRHGKNIRVDDSSSVAVRSGDFQHGIVFSDRPIALNELVSPTELN